MRARRENLFGLMEPLLPHVEKPSRYLDHEWGAVVDQDGPFHACLVYADVYEVGQPNLGIAILYGRINEQDGMSCERAYLPWTDMSALMRERDVPLLSLESAAPLGSFDVIGFTLAHELIFTNVLEALDLAGVALRADERDEDDPFVFGGGPSAWNCEPMAPAFDAVLLGDGEDGIVDMCACVRDARADGVSRADVLLRLSRIPGVYVPSLYDVVVDESSTRWGYAVPREGTGAPDVVLKRCLPDLATTNPTPQRIVPYLGIIQDREAVEILRGCARGCRFCQAGMTYRPVRERPADQVVEAGERGLAESGYDELSLTSLSTTDHSQCEEILNRLNGELAPQGICVSIPSQRLDSFGVEMAGAVAGSRRSGLTFAPEAGSQRLRDVINKNVTEEDLESAAR
ncbi:MAG: radical SAM protein, partial [Olsenella sp.]